MAIVFQLVAVDIGSRRNELVDALKVYACSERAVDMLMTRAGHVLLWRTDDTATSKIHPQFVDDTQRLGRLLKLTSEPIHLTSFDDRPDLFLAYWFGGASVNTADPAGAADVTDRFQNCNTNDDNDVDFVDYDLSAHSGFESAIVWSTTTRYSNSVDWRTLRRHRPPKIRSFGRRRRPTSFDRSPRRRLDATKYRALNGRPSTVRRALAR